MYYVDPLNNSLYKSERKAVLFLSDHIAIKALTYSSTHSHGTTVSCDLHFHIPYTLQKRPPEPTRKVENISFLSQEYNSDTPSP